MQKIILGIAAAVMVAIAAGAIVILMREEPPVPRPASVVKAEGADIGGPFTLTAHTGERVTSEALIDGPTLIYFGYTFCPDVCPVDAFEMAEATEMLAARGIEVTPVFITVDPARDDQKALGDWVDAMHPAMVGLTGSEEEIEAAAEAYKVVYWKVETADSAAEYLMSHTAYTYLIMPDGIAALFAQEATAEVIADEVERVLKARG